MPPPSTCCVIFMCACMGKQQIREYGWWAWRKGYIMINMDVG